jgi:EAL domain-containing protein (putative c-di-GMP-specific phosphodiesterase class I)
LIPAFVRVRLKRRPDPADTTIVEADAPSTALAATMVESVAAPISDAQPTAAGKGRVLVVDDEHALARSVARVLSGAGYTVTTVGDGAAGIEALKRSEFDVILSDIQMPGMSGVDLLRLVREHDLDVPVVLMTADPRVETAAMAVELGALQYLVKPVPIDVLRAAIERAARLHHMARMKRAALGAIGKNDSAAGDRAGLIAAFDRFLETMWLAFQPIVESRTRKTFGYEALLRSNEAALPHPGAVLAAAERLDRLPELGRRIRDLAASAFEHAPPDALMFVNLHTRDLLDPLLTSESAPLSRIARRVVLEITERGAVGDIKDIRSRVSALRDLGYRIAIDDLGAGYAGLTSFALLEPEFVKLDMSLVRGVHTSPIRQKLIGSMTQLCKEMGMQVVAEGVETIEERESVRELGCDLLQGYLLARPGKPFPEAVWP